jgi:peptidoglycan/xylan/chitin deacetylase (PgdA/CDA1 family)
MMKFLLQQLSPGGAKARLNTFIFHRVLAEPDPIFPDETDAKRFDEILGWITKWFNVIPLEEAIQRLKTKSLPPRAAAITFDDGYEDNFRIAMPLLKKYGVSATFFIATGFLNGGRMWNDSVIEAIRQTTKRSLDLTSIGLETIPVSTIPEKQAAITSVIDALKYEQFDTRRTKADVIGDLADIELPSDLMMTANQVQQMLAQGMQIGAHTVSHPILAKLDRKAAENEIIGSKIFLEELLKIPVKLFAYPNGRLGNDYLAEHALLTQKLGFIASASTSWGVSNNRTDLFHLPRFTPWDKTPYLFYARLIKNHLNKK